MAQYERGLYLTDVIATEIDEYVASFRDHWGLDSLTAPDHLDSGSWHLAKVVDLLAIQFVASARSLRQPVYAEEFAAMVKGLEYVLGEPYQQIEYIKQRIEIELVSAQPDFLVKERDRVLDLLHFLVSVTNIRAQEYLYRVAECYIKGLTAEGIIMCRAVLDAAIEEYVSDDAVQQTMKVKDRVLLGHRLQYLRNQSSLSAETIATIDDIRVDGNAAIHTTPSAVSDLRRKLAQLADVLGVLDATFGKDKPAGTPAT